ncbi:MAG: gamma-glutamyltransferase family protein, partial [Proteobacteria bacterium]|nr:gamma-glutamyltransferase family protein [Pseudomonadota bacterium]
MVATSEPLAAQAGLKILQDGGNAVDAAVATAAMLALVEPNSCGLGAEMFAIVYWAKDKKLYQISGNGWAPASWDIEYFTSRGLTRVPSSGIHSAMIPGSVDGMDKLLKRFGTLTFKEVLEPAATYAEEGFPVHEVLANSFHSNKNSLTTVDPDTAAIYIDENGEVPALYSIFKNPDMGHTFRLLQTKGRDVFYEGEIAHAMVEKANAVGGEWTYEDISEFEAEWAEPYSTSYHGYDIWETPAPSQGWAALEMLNILEVCAEIGIGDPPVPFDLAAIGRETPLFTHLEVEAKKLAYSDLMRYNADPRFEPPPLDILLSKEYAASLCPLISIDTARPADELGNLDGGTIYLTTADRWGNMVSFVYSVYTSFGSKVTIPGYGFQLSSRGAMFILDPDHPNRPEGRKRPFITIIASFITKDGEPIMSYGNMGGGTQPQAHV